MIAFGRSITSRSRPAHQGMRTVSSLVRVSKRFESVQALADLSFSVEPGRMLLPSARTGLGRQPRCGRSSARPDGWWRGAVVWAAGGVAGAAAVRLHARGRRGLYPRMPVREQLEYFGQLHGLDANAARAAARKWLERLGLAGGEAKVEELLTQAISSAPGCGAGA